MCRVAGGGIRAARFQLLNLCHQSLVLSFQRVDFGILTYHDLIELRHTVLEVHQFQFYRFKACQVVVS